MEPAPTPTATPTRTPPPDRPLRPMTPWPDDGHVHTEWSWDAVAGDLLGTCARAHEIGLRGLAFTEHAEFGSWAIPRALHDGVPARFRVHLDDAGRVAPAELDVAGYLEALDRARSAFPDLRLTAGVELSEPHRHPGRTAALLAAGPFDQVLGSVHTHVDPGGGAVLVGQDLLDPDEGMRRYLDEVLAMVRSDAPFTVLAHVDYPARYRPADARPFDPADFSDELHAVLTALAASGRALELNTRRPLETEVLRWWADVGGREISVGSDAHRPDALADGFADAAARAESVGFRLTADGRRLRR